jgi:hypothetical protein
MQLVLLPLFLLLDLGPRRAAKGHHHRRDHRRACGETLVGVNVDGKRKYYGAATDLKGTIHHPPM